MEELREKLLGKVKDLPGLTDREIADHLLGKRARVQSVNWAAHCLEKRHLIERRRRPDGKIGNYAAGWAAGRVSLDAEERLEREKAPVVQMSEEEVKRNVKEWLERDGWSVTVNRNPGRGADIEAQRVSGHWIIEARGSGSKNEIRSHYFLSVLGETLQRMDSPGTRYSVAFPDMRKFRNLWERFPVLGKARTGITALFVGSDGGVEEIQ
jgi:hypothetical protein